MRLAHSVGLSFLFAAIALVCGCGLIPSARVFQKAVPADAGKPAAQTEAERRGAQFIAKKSAKVEANPTAQIADIHAVSVPLSESLGEPAKPATIDDRDAIIAELRKGVLAQQKKADAWKAFALKYAGKDIEETGFDLAAPGAFLGVLGIVALFVFVPGALSVALIVIRRLRATVQTMAQAIEERSASHPEQGAALKARVAAIGDKAHSAIIDREMKFIDWRKVHNASRPKPTQTV